MTGNRRIGERTAIEPTDITWLPVQKKPRLRRRTKPKPALLVQLSVTGAGVVAPADFAVHAGTRAVIEIDGLHGLVEVRHIEPSNDPFMSLYGVEFLSLDPKLSQRINRTLSAGSVALVNPAPRRRD